ncbi:MAG TPA: nickel-responsive transcriptional regulator NikR [Spirochaetota bacterium]|nr:nickel-responsive transcriptional regulator NikR [Spirochaetota bacterium]HPN13181.1 nickel-responsive transcriptional regulator NikR [Spirochaetota bacterium]HQL82743.1 nickel-responsive transcriptional regulator NikR [Spirochaetota bacterium]
MNNIVRFGVSIDEKLLSRFDTIITGKGYVNRSEAIRDLIRDMLVSEDVANPESESIGTLTLVYSHDVHELSEKLNDIQHHYHRIIVSTTHIHLDEHNCLEVLILKGKARDVQTIADKLLAIKNVRHGKLSVTSAGKNMR